jgi:predicted transcriptional regulator
MKMARRNSFQVARDILAVADGGAIKTEIVYQANLNFKVVKRYLSDLIAKALIVQNGSRYHTTDGGRAFIRWMADGEDALRGGKTSDYL